MSDLEYAFRPSETSFYARLDVNPDADTSEIDKAGKLAFKKYAESDREDFLPIREAREALTDEHCREVYDRFYEELGVERGTSAYTKWESRGANSQEVERFLRDFSTDETTSEQEDYDDGDADQSEEESLWERVDIQQVVVTWANGKIKGAINANLWTDKGKRLYFNNFHPSGDIYLDLETGQFYTEDYDRVNDVSYTLRDDGTSLYVRHDDVQIELDLSGETDGNPLEHHLRIDDPEVASTNFGTRNVSVNLWKESRLYINGFHPDGDVYIWLQTGTVHLHGQDSEPIGDVAYEVTDDGTKLALTTGSRRVVIDLVGNRQSYDPDPSPRKENNSERVPSGGSDTKHPIQRELDDIIAGSLDRIAVLRSALPTIFKRDQVSEESDILYWIERPGVWIRNHVDPLIQWVLYSVILGIGVYLPDFVNSEVLGFVLQVPFFLVFSALLYAGGLFWMGLAAGYALYSGRFFLAVFFGGFFAGAFWYYSRIVAAMED